MHSWKVYTLQIALFREYTDGRKSKKYPYHAWTISSHSFWLHDLKSQKKNDIQSAGSIIHCPVLCLLRQLPKEKVQNGHKILQNHT